MAIMTSVLGSCSGRIGDKIYCERNGKTYVRSAPGKTKRGATLKQTAQRAKFAFVMRFLNPLRPFLENAAPIKNGKITLFNWIVQGVLRQSVIGNYPDFQIDYPSLQISYGSLSGLHELRVVECSIDQLGAEDELAFKRQVKFTWTHIMDSFCMRGNDLVRIVLYNATSKSFYFHEDTFRSDGKATIDISGALIGDTLHAYVFTESISGQRSTSQYLSYQL